jgi:hypothetical protein
MAVLCEAISVVVKVDRLLEVFETFDAFKACVPNGTLGADNELVRVGFMSPHDAEGFVHTLEPRDLVYQENGCARDMVVVDQMRGPVMRCDWIEFGQATLQGRQVAAARLVGSTSHQLIAPEGWNVEGSLSQTFGFVPNGSTDKSLKLLRTDSGVDVYLDTLTGKEVFVGRTNRDADA